MAGGLGCPGTEAKAVQIGGFELPDWTGPVELSGELLRCRPLHRLLHDKERGRSAGFVGAGLPQLDQLALEVGLQMGAMATLEGSQFFDLFLQHATFTTELLKKL
jgi:hypothetical protein